MKLVILAGGYGTRLSEETTIKPKPMAEIGNKPILWHIMKYYAHYGIKDFIILTGYKGDIINKYFFDQLNMAGNIELDFNKKSINYLNNDYKNWKVTCYNTGLNTMTGGRLKNIEHYLKDETFCMTYGDGLSNVNIKELINFHSKHKKIATVTAVKPIARFGSLNIEDDLVKSFVEKPDEERYINGGFFVLNRSVFKLLKSDETIFERSPLEQLAKEGNLVAFKHEGFWKPMDTLNDKNYLNELWSKDEAPWKIWE
jgi:glucose-1-phosphate cytidylyltransferase